MVIILIGYMASGKSTLGGILAKKLNYAFIDLDDYIEERESASVSEIFKAKGEIYFRKQEAFYLKELLRLNTNLILSVGGGTPCYGDNMEFILNADNVRSIYLKSSIPALVKKLINKKSTRPLIAHIETEEEMAAFIGKHLFERSQFYNKAEITIDTDNKTKNKLVKDILLKLI